MTVTEPILSEAHQGGADRADDHHSRTEGTKDPHSGADDYHSRADGTEDHHGGAGDHHGSAGTLDYHG